MYTVLNLNYVNRKIKWFCYYDNIMLDQQITLNTSFWITFKKHIVYFYDSYVLTGKIYM